jgi:sugar lactone lactonase YvrE
LRKKIGAARAPIVRSRKAFVIPEPDLLPEGIAHDPRRGVFYLGSIYKSKIVRLDRAGRRGDFKARGQDGLASVLGMKVDARRRLLWVCNNTRAGVASVHKYALDSGELIKKYTLDERPARRQFNDIALSRRGDAYVTDSLGAAIYEIPAGAGELRPLVRLDPGVYPNGVALSRDERRLYVATAAGISLIDVGAKTVAELARGGDVATTGADGLYLYRGDLVAVQNANPSPDRVVRLSLSADGGTAGTARVLESNHPDYARPTTGAVVGDELFYVANTQIDRMGAGGQIQPGAKLRDLILLRLKLN